MTTEIRIVQFFDLTDANGTNHKYQNYFVGTEKDGFAFAPFQVEGGVSTLNGDNVQIQVLFPTSEFAVSMVESAEGNRRSQLRLTTNTVSPDGDVSSNPLSQEFYIGLGASFSEDTIELRFNTAVDAVASNFPAQSLTEQNCGFLPLDSSLSLR